MRRNVGLSTLDLLSKDCTQIMPVRRILAIALLSCWLAPLRTSAEPIRPIPGLQAHLRTMSYHNPPGKPVWVIFSIENTSNEPITLQVPGAAPEIPPAEMGLPLSHVFSGTGQSGVALEMDSGRRWESPANYRRAKTAPILLIAPRSSVGTMVDLREYYPVLRGAGKYRINWHPYGGATPGATILLNVAPYKQAVIATDDGNMTLRFLYDEAPQTVANYVELVESHFYDGMSFHRLEPGYLIQGGCSRGDGTGIRLDGKRIPSEFNDRPHKKGSISMALLGDDPDSASSQFFISNTRQKDWDGLYSVFAELVGVESYATLDRLMATPVDDAGQPRRTLYIRSVRLIDAPTDAYDDMPTGSP